jgi:hypothetical protein
MKIFVPGRICLSDNTQIGQADIAASMQTSKGVTP